MHVSAALDRIEKRYLRDLWRAAGPDAVAELRIDLARFGPVQASIVVEEPEEPLVNVILGASARNAVESGHLANAVEWAGSHGVDYRVPVTPWLPDAEQAERWLMERGHEQGLSWMKFVRSTSPCELRHPRGIEAVLVDDRLQARETFSIVMEGAFGDSMWVASFISELQQEPGWRAYIAFDEDGSSLAGTAMLLDEGLAELGPLSVEGKNGGECLAALLDRCIDDAAAADCRSIFAEAPMPRPGERLSTEVEALFATGFEQAFVRSDWRPSRASVRPSRSPRHESIDGPFE